MKSPGHTVILFFSVLLISLLVKLFVLDVLYISGPSMKPTLSTGMFVIEYRLAWGIPVPFRNRYFVRWSEPEEGDIVIYPLSGRNVIKRCMATAGAPLVFSSERGYSVFIGDMEIPLDENQYQKLKTAECVPAGMIFALGDNMAESRDSRDYGFVSIDSIRGKALCK